MKINNSHLLNRFSISSKFFIARKRLYRNSTLLIHKKFYGTMSQLSLKEVYINFIKDLYDKRR